jgi:hypothetical protein
MSRRGKIYRHPDNYIAIYRHTFKTLAWQALSVGARAVYLELAANYNTKRMNAVYLAARTGAKRLGVDKKSVIKWLRELQHYGFIALVQGGSLGVDGFGLAQTFRLTDRPYANSPATYDFQNWSGELFKPEPTGGRNWQPKKSGKKNYPVPREGTPRTTGRDIVNSVPLVPLCTTGRDIGLPPDRTTGRDIASLTSCLGNLEAVGQGAQPAEWTTPVLTEIDYTPALRRLYRDTRARALALK